MNFDYILSFRYALISSVSAPCYRSLAMPLPLDPITQKN